jgi:hypothetical protein
LLCAPFARGASAQEAARLGADLTPVGAERAGNEAGTIPEWDGGLVSAEKAGISGASPAALADPYAGEHPLFRISAANLAQYSDRLSDGMRALLRSTHGTLFLNVFPAHRSVAMPERVYAASRRNATTAALAGGGAGITGATVGVPFPLPHQGLEVYWNHVLRFRGEALTRRSLSVAVSPDGSASRLGVNESFLYAYALPSATPGDAETVALYALREIIVPPARAGEARLTHDLLDNPKEPRREWSYTPVDRKVRRTSTPGFDAPAFAGEGLLTDDQVDMFSGSPERYDWRLVGKRELFVPYNAYRLHSAKQRAADIIRPGHLNPELLRYELHRVWVVEATLKAAQHHPLRRRVLYVDEDSWQVVLADAYDERGQLVRMQEAHGITDYTLPAFRVTVELAYDFTTQRYLANGLEESVGPSEELPLRRAPQDYAAAVLGTRR